MSDPAITALGTEPIPGGKRAGETARYDAEFLALEAEIGKLQSLTGGDTDWSAVVGIASGILASRSKDLLVAVYLTRGLLQQRGFSGLAEGLRLCRDLLTNFWDDMFPQATRLRARRSCLQWLSDHLGQAVAAQTTADPALVTQCRELIDEISAYCQSRFEGEDSGLAGLRRSLPSDVNRSLTATGDAHSVASDASADPTSPPAKGTSVNPPRHNSGPITSRDEAFRQLQDLADYFARTEPHSPLGMVLKRAVRWGPLSFQEVYQDLLANSPDAQNAVWQALGMKSPG